MIIDDSGQVVWFHPLRGPYGRAMNFETQTYQGRDVLTWGQTPGEYKIFDDSYHEIARFKAANGYDGDHHEFLLSPQHTPVLGECMCAMALSTPEYQGSTELPTCLTPSRSLVVSRAAKLLGYRFWGSLVNFLSLMRDGLACSRLASRRYPRRAE
jgi:hypothetical protein